MPELNPDSDDLPVFETGPLFEAHPLAHIIYDVEHLRLLAVNAAAVERYGYSREELLNLTRLDLLLGSERAAAKIAIADLAGNEARPSQWIFRERTRDGRVLHSDTRRLSGLYGGRRARMVVVLDATPGNKLEAKPDQARELVAAAGRLAQVGAWSVDLRSKHIFWSDVVCEIHEVAPGYVCKLDEAVAFYPGEAALTMRGAVKRCLNTGSAFDLELPFVSAKGTARWVRATGEAVCDEAGRVVILRGAQQDITRRKRAEIELQDSRARLAATLRAIPDLWFILDREGRYLEVSSPDHPAMAFQWEKVIGRRFMDMDHVPPELIKLSADALQRLAASGQQQVISYERETLQMGRRAFEARLVPMFDGRVLYLTRDVTELHDAQRRLEGILRAIPDLWFVIDADDRFVEVSSPDDPRLVRPWREVVGRRFDEVLDAELGRMAMKVLGTCRETGQPQAMEYSFAVSDAGTMHFDGRFAPLDGGRVLFFARDVTAYKRAQQDGAQ